MRQQQINHETFLPNDKKQSMNKKRMIRKNKLQNSHPNNDEHEDLKPIDTSKITRQERAKIQKVKNRQAAQRSRDMHREYVSCLQKEVGQLRELKDLMMSSRKYCAKCQKQMLDNDHQQSNSTQHHNQDKTKSQLKQPLECQNSHFQIESEDSSAFYHQLNYFDGQEESFLRLDSNNNNSSYMSTIFFVTMIVVGALIYGNYYQKHDQPKSRSLMEIPELPKIPQIKEQPKEMIANHNKSQSLQQKNNADKTALAPLQSSPHGILVKFNDDDCLQSLMNRSATAQDKKSLRSYHTQIIQPIHEGILLCTVRIPKNSQNKLSNIKSSLIKLYLLGSQIKQMITASNLMIPLKNNNNIQINGLYKISAEIKDVSLVSDHHCLL